MVQFVEIKLNYIKENSMSDNRQAREELHYYRDLTNMKFGRLKVVKYLYTKQKKAIWLCQCDCGNSINVNAGALTSGNTKSCGCLKHDIAKKHYSQLNKKHGMKNTKIYKKWLAIKKRCSKQYTKDYKNYGGRGIKVCDEWKNDFMNFYNWAIENGYREDLTLDRIDVNGNYEPNNCRWITNLEQQNNKRNNRYIEYNKEKHTISEWSRLTGINKNTLLQRINRKIDKNKIFYKGDLRNVK